MTTGCAAQTTKKYTSRPSPPFPANECREGKTQRGNDGLMYVTKANKNGVNRWVKAAAVGKNGSGGDECVVETSKKYTTRPSPPFPANKYPVDKVQEGNDGNLYVVRTNKNGVNRWHFLASKAKGQGTKVLAAPSHQQQQRSNKMKPATTLSDGLVRLMVNYPKLTLSAEAKAEISRLVKRFVSQMLANKQYPSAVLAMRSILSGELVKHATHEASKAVADPEVLIWDVKMFANKFTQAPLTWGVDRGALYVTAAAEYLAAEMLNVAVGETNAEGRTTITGKDLKDGLLGDEELQAWIRGDAVYPGLLNSDKERIFMKMRFSYVAEYLSQERIVNYSDVGATPEQLNGFILLTEDVFYEILEKGKTYETVFLQDYIAEGRSGNSDNFCFTNLAVNSLKPCINTPDNVAKMLTNVTTADGRGSAMAYLDEGVPFYVWVSVESILRAQSNVKPAAAAKVKVETKVKVKVEPTLSSPPLSSLTVDKLKALLRQNGLKVSGNKAQLIARLLGQPAAPAASSGRSSTSPASASSGSNLKYENKAGAGSSFVMTKQQKDLTRFYTGDIIIATTGSKTGGFFIVTKVSPKTAVFRNIDATSYTYKTGWGFVTMPILPIRDPSEFYQQNYKMERRLNIRGRNEGKVYAVENGVKFFHKWDGKEHVY